MRIAAYARYSTDMQREASLEDQLRNCRNYCQRQGWPDPEIYTDAGISGARNDRPGYQRMLANAHRYDVILVDDLSRLSRDSIASAQAVKRLKFAGVRLIGVSDGVDTSRKSHKADVGLRGLMSELYLDDLAEKTHRGMMGRALNGASAGGLPYGYRVAGVGQRAVDKVQAEIVRRIYSEYLAGASPRQIAAGLNRDRVTSPRGGQWAMSVIYGDVRRGIGILANPIYAGRQIWNKSHWTKHPDTGRKVRQERPQSEWTITEHPELAIVDPATWNAVQARIRGKRSPLVVSSSGAGPGRPPRHLLSGLLRCECCGGAMVVVDRYRYGCATNKDRGSTACPSRLRVPREAVETAMLAGIKQEVLTEARFAQFQREVQAVLKRSEPDTQAPRRKLSEAEKVRDNVMAAIRLGIITPSTKAELEAAERAIEEAKHELEAMLAYQPTQVLPRLRERWRSIADRLSDVARNINAAREAIQELLGDRIIVKNENGTLIAEVPSSSEITVVAGAGFEPATFGL
jgi:site-specific DNA recombinase